MAHGVIVFATFFLFGMISGAEIQTKRYYHIEAFDGSLVTIGGDNSDGVKVITEDNHGSDPRQSFWVGAGDSHELQPQAQNTFSTLTVALELKSKLIVQQTRGYFARRQWWHIHDLGENKYAVQNVDSGLCMSSNGKSNQLVGAICDRSSVNQTFVFNPVPKRSAPVNLE